MGIWFRPNMGGDVSPMLLDADLISIVAGMKEPGFHADAVQPLRQGFAHSHG